MWWLLPYSVSQHESRRLASMCPIPNMGRALWPEQYPAVMQEGAGKQLFQQMHRVDAAALGALGIKEYSE